MKDWWAAFAELGNRVDTMPLTVAYPVLAAWVDKT